jgi:ribonuclease-3 family protein
MEELNLRSYAHLGDAVWELFVREFTVYETQNLKTLHKLTTDRVNSKYQADMLAFLSEVLTEEEQDLARRARNCPIPVARRNNQTEYRQATAFEALIGYWYLHNKPRYKEIIDKIKKEFFVSNK